VVNLSNHSLFERPKHQAHLLRKITYTTVLMISIMRVGVAGSV